jgi:hypothetical protein
MPRRGGLQNQHNPTRLRCSVPDCRRWFKNASGRTKHIRVCHNPHAAMRRVRRRRLQLRSSPIGGPVHVEDIPLVSESSSGRSPPPSSISSRVSHPSMRYSPLSLNNADVPLHRDERSPSQAPWGPGLAASPVSQRLRSLSPSHSPYFHPLPLFREPTPDGDAPMLRIYHPLINGEDLLGPRSIILTFLLTF